MKRIARVLGFLLLGLLVIGLGAWLYLAVINARPDQPSLSIGIVLGFVIVPLAVLIALWFRRLRWVAVGIYLLMFATILVWWRGIEPSNTRDWQTDVATLASATIDGDIVTVHNIRNFDYRTESDYTPHYYDKRFDLRELTGVDVIAVYWMGPAIAHVFLSFEFNNTDHLAVSIETRKEKGEGYSTLNGFFRRYELFYVVADERDVIGLRTNYRKDPVEDVYVYRAKGAIENGRRLFLEYIRQINALNTKPDFYNTITTNCTTSIWLNTRVNSNHIPFDWKVLVSGYLPQFLYENNRLETYGLSFDELQRKAHVNARAIAAGSADDFSQRIRAQEVVQ